MGTAGLGPPNSTGETGAVGHQLPLKWMAHMFLLPCINMAIDVPGTFII